MPPEYPASLDANEPDVLRTALARLAAGERLGESLVAGAFGRLMSGGVTPAQIAGLLMGLRMQGETGSEVAGAARALREAMIHVPLPDGVPAIDTCGTGGGAVTTFNVSTAAALVALGAGATVAKHGNRSYTSRCGSADVLEALGVEIALDARRAVSLLERAGMAFLFAPAFHPAMTFVAPVRRDLGVPTIMNLVGPLANPAGVRRQVLGVADRDRAAVVADALALLGSEHALVVNADVGMDEIAPSGMTSVWEVRGKKVETWRLDPKAYELATPDVTALAGGEPAENADRIVRLFADAKRDPAARSAVALNGGAAVYVAGLARDFAEGVRLAEASLDDGAAARALETLRREGASTSE